MLKQRLTKETQIVMNEIHLTCQTIHKKVNFLFVSVEISIALGLIFTQ
jgi:hypothetical protein